jgi:small GTP-binding protein
MGNSGSKKETKKLQQFRITVIGPPGVGKTQIIQRICNNSFSSEFKDAQTFTSKNIDNKYQLVFTDSPGSFELRGNLHYYLKEADIVFLVFSVDSDPNDLISFLENVDKHNFHCKKVMICNKIDLKDFTYNVNPRIQDFVKEYLYDLKFCSALHNKNIDHLTKNLIIK